MRLKMKSKTEFVIESCLNWPVMTQFSFSATKPEVMCTITNDLLNLDKCVYHYIIKLYHYAFFLMCMLMIKRFSKRSEAVLAGPTGRHYGWHFCKETAMVFNLGAKSGETQVKRGSDFWRWPNMEKNEIQII